MFTFSFRAFNKLRELMKQHRFDIIHDNQTLGYGNLLMKSFGVPVVATIHHPLPIDRMSDLPYIDGVEAKIRRILFYPMVMQHLAAWGMDRVITVSEDAAAEIHNSFKVPYSRIRVVYNGVDTDKFRIAGGNGAGKERGRLVVVANTRDRKKGVIYLLRAMRLLRRELDVKLTIVDQGLPDNEYTPSLARRLGLDGCVEFTGRVSTEELVKHYTRAEVAVVPSLYEGFGFPAAEAMACGVPVVSTTAGALPEVVGDDGCGILVPPRDPGAIAVAVKRLLADEGLRREMGERGRGRVEQLFSWRAAAEKMLEVYREVM
jgi:glycosyltransferase involved in cell wall biosynthesis